jgi:hypothetical protein
VFMGWYTLITEPSVKFSILSRSIHGGLARSLNSGSPGR